MKVGPRASRTGTVAIAIAAALVAARPPAARALDCTNTSLGAALELAERLLGGPAGDEVDFSGDGAFNIGDIVVQLLVAAEQTMLPPTCGVLGACGDGIVQGGRGEGCDDGNLLDEDGCSALCVAEFCGDTVVQAGLGELCDDGNMAGGDGCDAACATEVCGNGVLQGLLGELCDDGNLDGGDGCDPDCATEVCGNGVLQGALGETCDDGNTDAGDGCDGTCRIEAVCGNGAVEPGETCDDGNTDAGDGCDGTCRIEAVCGNGAVEEGETCDDGNTDPGDGCDANCRSEQEAVELLATRDVCLNVADGAQVFEMQLFDGTKPDAQFILVPDADPPVGPSAEVALSTDGRFTATIDGPEDVGDYAFALASTAARFDIFNLKVVNDPAPPPFPAATRPFRLGMVPTQGRYDYTFSDGAGINLPHPAGAAAVLQSLGAAELQLIQTYPEWALPYGSLEDAQGTLRRAAQNIRGTGRDVIFSLDIFGSGFRDRITLPTDDAAEICAACGLGVPDASGTLCTGGAVDFSCETLRTRLGDYAEAVAETVAPPYMTIGVEMDLYEFSRPGDYANFATAFKAAAQRVKAVSPDTKVFVTIQYEGMLVLEVLTNPFANKDQLVRDKVARVLNPLAPENELYVITTFPEILRAADLGRDGNPNLDVPIEDWNDPADMPDDYYKYVTDFLGQPGYPPAAAALESGWSTQDVDTMTCEDLAFFPLTRASALNADDGIGDPAVTFRSEAGQQRAFHRMIELMYEQLHPEFLIWFYARNPTQLGTTPVLPIFQTMGLREDLYEFNGGCVGVPDQPLNESKVAVVGERSKDALCDWLRLLHLPYAP